MKAFRIWLLCALGVFGAAAGALTMYSKANPCAVIVALDMSVSMQNVWSKLPNVLDDIDNDGFATYTLAGPRSDIHGPADTLRLGKTQPYGPRDLSRFKTLGDTACRRILISNAPPDALADFEDWDVVRP